MTSTKSDMSVAHLVDVIIENQKKQAQAVQRNNTTAANRYMRRVNSARNELAAMGTSGRTALEELMQHPIPQVRLDGAVSVMEWAPDRAIPVLGKLIVDTIKPSEMSVSERIEVSHEAMLSLFDYFGTKFYERDELIEPLKGYGVELPPRK